MHFWTPKYMWECVVSVCVIIIIMISTGYDFILYDTTSFRYIYLVDGSRRVLVFTAFVSTGNSHV